jgi:predicted dehydrogenase
MRITCSSPWISAHSKLFDEQELPTIDHGFDYHELLANKDRDAVSITTHIDDHSRPTLLNTLEGGKHVFLKKPMAKTVAECDRVTRAA